MVGGNDDGAHKHMEGPVVVLFAQKILGVKEEPRSHTANRLGAVFFRHLPC